LLMYDKISLNLSFSRSKSTIAVKRGALC